MTASQATDPPVYVDRWFARRIYGELRAVCCTRGMRGGPIPNLHLPRSAAVLRRIPSIRRVITVHPRAGWFHVCSADDSLARGPFRFHSSLLFRLGAIVASARRRVPSSANRILGPTPSPRQRFRRHEAPPSAPQAQPPRRCIHHALIRHATDRQHSVAPVPSLRRSFRCLLRLGDGHTCHHDSPPFVRCFRARRAIQMPGGVDVDGSGDTLRYVDYRQASCAWIGPHGRRPASVMSAARRPTINTTDLPAAVRSPACSRSPV